MPWFKAIALWFGILLLAVANGGLREKLLIPALGSAAGLVSSGVLLSVCVFVVALAGAPWLGSVTSEQRLSIGVLWLVLTLVFEFGFGRFVQRKTWQQLLEAYTFKGGNIWPLVLLVVLFAPWLAARFRGLA